MFNVNDIDCPECGARKMRRHQFITFGLMVVICENCEQMFFLGKDLVMIDNNEVAYDSHFWEYISAHK